MSGCHSDDESSDNETEPLAARIARQSRTTKAKVKYTLSDDDDDDDDNDEKNNLSSEDEWMQIRSSDSEDELSIIKVQKQPSKKAVKFSATTKDQDKMDTGDSVQTTGVVEDPVAEDKATDEVKIMDDDDLELPAITKPLTDSKPLAENTKRKAAPKKKPKQDKGTKKTTSQMTLFDTGVKLKAEG